jgi:hypothetical protein
MINKTALTLFNSHSNPDAQIVDEAKHGGVVAVSLSPRRKIIENAHIL